MSIEEAGGGEGEDGDGLGNSDDSAGSLMVSGREQREHLNALLTCGLASE